MDIRGALRERVVLADGAMGTYLYASGAGFSTCLEELNLSNPSLVRRVHEEYRDAGAELLQTNTFGANSVRLARNGLAARCVQINRAGVRCARAAAGRQGWVAGSVGPLGKDMGGAARAIFAEQIAALDDAGADVILLETFRDPVEVRVALLAAHAVSSLPIIVQMSPDEHGNLSGGVTIAEYAPLLLAWGADAVGCNCGSGSPSFRETVQNMVISLPRPLTAQPSAGLPVPGASKLLYRCSPQAFAADALALAESGVTLLGGCCGTTPAHIRAVRDALQHDWTVLEDAEVLS